MTQLERIHATTVVAVRHRGQVAVAGDGQVSIGNTIVKAGARKVRKLYGDRQQFELKSNKMGGLTASLSIPFHLLDGAAVSA